MIAAISIGVMFSLIFHIFVKEKPTSSTSPDFTVRSHVYTLDWFRNIQFYQVGCMYMGTRLFVNLSQVFMPLYLQDVLHLPQSNVAIIPLIMSVSGFITSTLMTKVNILMGRKVNKQHTP